MKLLEDCHCYGISRTALDRFIMDLVGLVDDKNLKDFWTNSIRGKATPYPASSCFGMAVDQGVDELYNHLTEKDTKSDFNIMMETVARTQHVYMVLPLLLADVELERIVQFFVNRFKKEISIGVIEKIYYYFTQFGSLTEKALLNWIESCPQRLCYLMRVALYEPVYKLIDELGLDMSLEPSYVSSRIMLRSLRHFEDLSKSRHYKAMAEARHWAKIALDASEKNQKSKQTNVSSFLGEFQLSLYEATDDMIDSHEGDDND